MRWAILLLVAACQSSAAGGAPPPPATSPPAPPRVVSDVTAQDYPMPPLPRARVTLVDAFGARHRVEVEVAATRQSRTRGMMWRTAVEPGKGMLFIFPAREQLSFWMKNTLIPLDMIFIDEDRTIVGIVERAEPHTLTSRGPDRPARYVLEVEGGYAARVGLRPGLKVELEGIQAIVPTP